MKTLWSRKKNSYTDALGESATSTKKGTMDANPFSIESILKKKPVTSSVNDTEETQPSKSREALSLAVKLAGKRLMMLLTHVAITYRLSKIVKSQMNQIEPPVLHTSP